MLYRYAVTPCFTDTGLCVKKKRFRLKLPEVLEMLGKLLQDTTRSSQPDVPAPLDTAGTPADPSPLSRQVRGMRRDLEQSVQRNVSEAFATCMRRLDELYQTHRSQAPPDFLERLDYWHSTCKLPSKLHSRMHTLRIWRNASEHDDQQRWAREGPCSAQEAERFIAKIDRTLTMLM
jgi:hypothetical protein